MDKRTIVISGVNLVDGGPLSVFLDLLDTLVENGYADCNRVIALVGKKELFDKYNEKIELIEYRKAKRSWLYRLFCEYVLFYRFSKIMDVDIWISMHDTTPNVRAKYRYVYCHNPSPFNEMSIKDAKYGWKYYLFSKFYKYLYRINIRKNDAVIVQQDWMRKEFKEIYGLKRVIVARPNLPNIERFEDKSSKETFVCVYPSFPRYYKNFQVACEAARVISKESSKKFKLYITLSGTENKYSSWLKTRYGNEANIEFCGLLSREELFNLYERSNCLIFMSKLETWGMPITEYEVTGKPMIVSDLPYAHETVGCYKNVAYVQPDDYGTLETSILNIMERGKFNCEICKTIPDQPFAESWKELVSMLINGEY